MPTLKIEYFEVEGEIIPLLSEKNKESFKAQIKEMSANETEDEPSLSLLLVQLELSNDEECRKKFEIKEAVFEVRRPILEDQIEIFKESNNSSTNPQAYYASYKRLSPKGIGPWENKEIPYEFQTVLAQECHALIFPDMGEKRRFFLMRSQESSPKTEE